MNLYNENFKLVLKGFLMGMADIVPGVSGGTVAFILGIYDRLVAAIASVNLDLLKLIKERRFKDALKHVDFTFLFFLLSGIFLALILMSRLMHYVLNEHPVPTWALFFGLILASIFYLKNQIKDFYRGQNILLTILGAIIAYFVVGAIPTETPNDYLTIFLSGAIAIIAMILPGISGSFILLILGKYIFITEALKSPFINNHLLVLITFSLGCLVGILSFSKILNFLLNKFHSLTLCFLTGFMIGSLRKIWPWKETLETMEVRGKIIVLSEKNILPHEFNSTFFIAISLFVIGFLAVFLLERSQAKKG